jgi:uncharacterized protein YjbI with pentapeptide repeats
MLGIALVIAGAVTATLFYLVPFRPFKTEALSTATLYDILKVAFAFAAGIGGVVALVTAYRRQRVSEFAHQLATRAEERANRTEQQQHEIAQQAEHREANRLFNERFTTAAGQLGHDNPAIRLAGVYAMAGLADDWIDQRQTCVDVLCAYLRMPYQPWPPEDAPAVEHQAFLAIREVRHTVIRVIASHLQADELRAATAQDWRGLDFDFTGALFDGGDFDGIVVTGGTMSFRNAQFSLDELSFYEAQFIGGRVDFTDCQIHSGEINFMDAQFCGSSVDFFNSRFNGGMVRFKGAKFTEGTVTFYMAKFDRGTVRFHDAQFDGGFVGFNTAQFSHGLVDFLGARFNGSEIRFNDADFKGSPVIFAHAQFSSGEVSFTGAHFGSGTLDFQNAQFIGGNVTFEDVQFAGAKVDFRRSERLVPPDGIDWNDPPHGVELT